MFVIQRAASASKDLGKRGILLFEPLCSDFFLSKSIRISGLSGSACLACAGLGSHHQWRSSLQFISVASGSLVLSGEPGEASSFPSM